MCLIFFFFFHMMSSVFRVICWRDFHCSIYAFDSLFKISTLYLWRSMSGLSVLFYLPLCLLFCQYHPVLITVALWKLLTLGNDSPPTLFSFNDLVAIRSLLPLLQTYNQFLDIYKITFWDLYWNYTESTD